MKLVVHHEDCPALCQKVRLDAQAKEMPDIYCSHPHICICDGAEKLKELDDERDQLARRVLSHLSQRHQAHEDQWGIEVRDCSC